AGRDGMRGDLVTVVQTCALPISCAPEIRAAAHDRAERARQAALRAGTARPSDPVGRSRSGVRALAGSRHSPAREAQVRGDFEAQIGRASCRARSRVAVWTTARAW